MLPLWKSLSLGLYYHGTRPLRRWRNAATARAGRMPIAIVFYHRVADDAANEWTVSNAMFARQMDWLTRDFDVVSLEEAQRRIRSGNNSRPTACITFDDGYADNCQQALPLLIRRRIPCTYFVCNEQVMERTPFPHDRVAGHSFAANSIDELRDLAAAGIEIGAHTRSHCDLGKLSDPQRLADEIITAGEELQSALGKPVRYFAFPFGQHENLNRSVFHLAYEAGYEAVCSAYGGLNYPGDDAFHLQRFAGDYSLLRLMNWATIDPRKSHVHRYEYENPAQQRLRSGAISR